MPTLWFVVPVHGRRQLAAICLRQLRRTCDALTEHGIHATAVVIADRSNLRDMRGRLENMLGFATIERDNAFLSRRFNDGFQLALDERHNPHPADYVVPCGSDDWIDHRILLNLPAPDTVLAFRHLSFVREDGQEIVSRYLGNVGGCGLRVYPRQVMATCGFRPADEDRVRACDTSTITNLFLAGLEQHQVAHLPINPYQIVDWKSPSVQLNSYESLRRHKSLTSSPDPFEALAGVYPAEALDEMAAHYGRVPVAA